MTISGPKERYFLVKSRKLDTVLVWSCKVSWSSHALCHTSLEASHPLESRGHWMEMCYRSQFWVITLLLNLYLFLVIENHRWSLVFSKPWKATQILSNWQSDLSGMLFGSNWYSKLPKLALTCGACGHHATQFKVRFTHITSEKGKTGFLVRFPFLFS